jgi:hypothetical protein
VNGPPVVATIDPPGTLARYQFTAAAGATVTVEATDSTLPSQCSPLTITDPAGEFVRSGCLISGEGDIREVTLPTAGTYSLIVDPSDAATGVVTLAITS